MRGGGSGSARLVRAGALGSAAGGGELGAVDSAVFGSVGVALVEGTALADALGTAPGFALALAAGAGSTGTAKSSSSPSASIRFVAFSFAAAGFIAPEPLADFAGTTFAEVAGFIAPEPLADFAGTTFADVGFDSADFAGTTFVAGFIAPDVLVDAPPDAGFIAPDVLVDAPPDAGFIAPDALAPLDALDDLETTFADVAGFIAPEALDASAGFIAPDPLEDFETTFADVAGFIAPDALAPDALAPDALAPRDALAPPDAPVASVGFIAPEPLVDDFATTFAAGFATVFAVGFDALDFAGTTFAPARFGGSAGFGAGSLTDASRTSFDSCSCCTAGVCCPSSHSFSSIASISTTGDSVLGFLRSVIAPPPPLCRSRNSPGPPL